MTNRLLCCALLWLAPLASAESIVASNNGAKISAAAVGNGVFRISVSTDPAAKPIDSIFIAKTLNEIGKLENNAIVTPAGTLKLDPQTGNYELLNSDGKSLIPSSAVIADKSADSISLHVGWPAGKPFDIYACGNDSTTLIQHKIDTHVGNGIAVEPFFYSPSGFAVLAVAQNDNDPAKCDGKIDGGAVTWKAAGTAMDLYVMVAPTLGDATRQLLSITGTPPVPPRWTLGYLQSRWGWKDRAYIDDTLKHFQDDKLPVDAFIFDFEWYTKYPDYGVKPEGNEDFKDFSFNEQLFPEPAAQIKALHDAGVRFVGIRKPRLGNASTLKMLRQKEWGFHSTGKDKWDARGIWFANPQARDWYAEQTVPLLKTGVDGWWDDEGEFTYTHYLYWNVAQRTALDAINPKARLWTIDRAFQPGLARYGAACWTGDIRASWKAFERTPTDLLNWSTAGMPWCGCDIGGFGGETTPQLLTRWMEAGTFFPVMRTHSEVNVKPHFPWLFGEEAEAAMKKALELRYRLVPMLYSLAHDAKHPLIMRPLIAEFADDKNVADRSDEWMFGPSILAAPVLTESNDRKIYLPSGEWFDFFSGEKIAGGKEIRRTVAFDAVPVFVRAGSILPLGPVVQHTSELPGGPLEVRVYPGNDADFTLLEDDGVTTPAADEDGMVLKTHLHWNNAARELSWRREGAYNGADRFVSMHVVAADTNKTVAVNESDFGGDGALKLP